MKGLLQENNIGHQVIFTVQINLPIIWKESDQDVKEYQRTKELCPEP